jgi:hypothetical protein
MGKSSPSPPPAPDYAGAAREQGVANEATARLQGRINNPNVSGPLGGQTVTFGEGDQPTITQTLTPDAQSTLEAQQRVQRSLANLGEQGIGTARTALANPFSPNSQGLQLRIDTSNLARMPVNAGTTGQEAIMARLAPQLERQDAATRSRLLNQGLVPGGEAYENAMISENQRKNDLLTQAVVQGIGLDTNTRAQGFNEASSEMAAQNAAQQAELQREAFLRQQPLNEITGLMSGSQIQMPQFQGYSPTSIAPAPLFAGAQAQGQSDMDRYGIQSANTNAQNAGLYNMIGNVGMLAGKTFFSDRRLKSNIDRIGTHPLGIGVYEYNIFDRRERGVMADEVEAVMPEAVVLHQNGYKMVNYGMLT